MHTRDRDSFFAAVKVTWKFSRKFDATVFKFVFIGLSVVVLAKIISDLILHENPNYLVSIAGAFVISFSFVYFLFIIHLFAFLVIVLFDSHLMQRVCSCKTEADFAEIYKNVMKKRDQKK